MGHIRRECTRQFKLEGVRLVMEGSLSLVQAAKDLGSRGNLLGQVEEVLWRAGFISWPQASGAGLFEPGSVLGPQCSCLTWCPPKRGKIRVLS